MEVTHYKLGSFAGWVDGGGTLQLGNLAGWVDGSDGNDTLDLGKLGWMDRRMEVTVVV